jgi:NAD-dependent protein deacetylase/lipoamidase
MATRQEITELAAALAGARSLCVLTGAGVSAESGIPTFRGPDGLWRNFRIDDLATPEAFSRNPQLVWEWYAWRREIMHQSQPNPAHYALAEIEDQFLTRPGAQFTLVTQNVDGLHERAGSRRVLRLHGNIWGLRCATCGAEREDHSVPLDPFPPRCASNHMMRPAVVWFGEALPEDALRPAIEAAARSDLFLVVGTSALVYPAASLPLIAKEKGARLIEVNPERTPLSEIADAVLTGKAGDILGALRQKRTVM